MAAISLEASGDFTLVHLPARLDVTSTKPLVEAMRAAIAEGKCLFVFDFGGTVTIDSTALGAIIQLYKTVKSKEGDLRLARVGDGVKRVLAITRVDRVFSLFDSVEEATRLAS